MGLARVGTRAQVGESIVRRGRGREYRTRVGIPVFNAFPSSLNQLDTTSRLFCLSYINQEAIRFAELILRITAPYLLREHRDFSRKRLNMTATLWEFLAEGFRGELVSGSS